MTYLSDTKHTPWHSLTAIWTSMTSDNMWVNKSLNVISSPLLFPVFLAIHFQVNLTFATHLTSIMWHVSKWNRRISEKWMTFIHQELIRKFVSYTGIQLYLNVSLWWIVKGRPSWNTITGTFEEAFSLERGAWRSMLTLRFQIYYYIWFIIG